MCLEDIYPFPIIKQSMYGQNRLVPGARVHDTVGVGGRDRFNVAVGGSRFSTIFIIIISFSVWGFNSM